MSANKNVLFVLNLCILFLTIRGFEDEWTSYESKFKNHIREEIFISSVSNTNTTLLSNLTINSWKTLNTGWASYTGGILEGTKLAVLFTKAKDNENGVNQVVKVFELNETISDIEFFHQPMDQVWVIVLTQNNNILWYSLREDSMENIWTWTMEDPISHFHVFRMQHQPFLLINALNNQTKIYGFKISTLERWLYQAFNLPAPSPSSCFSTTDTDFFLVFAQPSSGKTLIYQRAENKFVEYTDLNSPGISQVICFQDSMRSWFAINGLNASIVEFAGDGLVKRKISNSNLEKLQFWLPMSVNTYRYETILIFQRKLDHETHNSYDVEIVTYNGRRFEEHMDVPCMLFGEVHSGLECLTEFSPDVGIEGSSYIALHDYVALVVPNPLQGSALFTMKLGHRKVEHPVKKELDYYSELKEHLQDIIEDQNLQLDEYKKISLSSPSDAPILRAASRLQETNNNFRIQELENEVQDLTAKYHILKDFFEKNDVDSIVFDGPVTVLGLVSAEEVLSEDTQLNGIINDLFIRDQLQKINGKKLFKNLSVNHMLFEEIDGISKDDFILADEANVTIKGNICFGSNVSTEKLTVTEDLINDVSISKWITVENLADCALKFEDLVSRNSLELTNTARAKNLKIIDEAGSLYIPGNVTVQEVNSQDFEKFLRKLCLRNIPCVVPELVLSGTMNVEGSATLNGNLNDLIFPDEFVDLTVSEPFNITALKNFRNTVKAQSISTTNNSINGINLSQVVHLYTEQNITGDLTFEDLEVVQKIQVDPVKIKGEAVKVLPNIGLKDSRVIDSNVQFLQLEVLGDIVIANTFNGSNFTEYLDSIIVKDENTSSVNIRGRKEFPQGLTVHHNLQVDSRQLNTLPMDSLVTKSTAQDLNLSSISGNVNFQSLSIEGLVDAENITDLFNSFVKTSDGHQIISSELVFEHPLEIDTLRVTKEYLQVGLEDLELTDVVAENVHVDGNIEGEVEGLDIDTYLKYTEDQVIGEPFYISELKCQDIKSNIINGINVEEAFTYKKLKHNISDMLMYRNASVDSLSVQGDLELLKVNKEDFAKMLNNHGWTKLYRNSSWLVIDGDVHFENLHILNLTGVPFDDYIKTVVFKNQSYVTFKNSLTFENGIDVDNLVETSTLNGVAVNNILRKSGKQTLKGPVHVFGNVSFVDDVTVKEMINGVDVTYILNNFDLKEEDLRVKGELLFRRLPYIQNLTINGLVNGKNFSNLLEKFVVLNESDIYLDNNTFFMKQVDVKRNFAARHNINGINFSNIASRIAWINNDADIGGSIKFTNAAICSASIDVDNAVTTNFLWNKNFSNYVDQAVFVDHKGFLPGKYAFDQLVVKENLETKFVNNLDMGTVIPLKTAQDLGEMHISHITVVHDVYVGNEVNGVNLNVEQGRTLLRDSDQSVPSEVIFQNNVMIEGALSTSSINNKPVEKIVTTNTDQILAASYRFNYKTIADANMTVSGLVGGVNVTSWKEKSLWKQSNPTQLIPNDLRLETLNLTGPLDQGVTVNSLEINQLVVGIQDKEADLCDSQTKIMEELDNICKNLTYIYNRASEQKPKFNYLEELQTLSAANNLHYVKPFRHQNQQYLLVNEENSCFSDVMKFGSKGFFKFTTVRSGIILQMVEVTSKEKESYLVIRGDDGGCMLNGLETAIWKWSEEDMKIVSTIEAQDLLQSSQQPLTFYGLRKGVVTEFKINPLQDFIVEEFRRWNIKEEDAAFVPPGLKTGLAMRTGKELIVLNSYEVYAEAEEDLHSSSTVIGNTTRRSNSFFPGKSDSDLAVVEIGGSGGKRNLLAVARLVESTVESEDYIEIYSDPLHGKLFQKILVRRPTALTSMEFGNGESMLVFMEDRKVFHMYEYKGIEGFRQRFSIKIQAFSIFSMGLPSGDKGEKLKVLGLVFNNKLTLLRAEMLGKRVPETVNCLSSP